MSGDIAKLRWHRGPWVWDTSDPSTPHWRAPTGAVGSVDLRSLPDQMAAGTSAGLGLFVSYDTLPSEYDLLGVGSPRDVKPGQKIKDAIPARAKFSVQGDDLLTMLRSCLMDGSDPTGDSYARPLMPESDMRFGFHVGPWSDWQKTAPWNDHWDKVQDVLRADFRVYFADAMAGRMNDDKQHLRVLDALCDKYGADDWKSFVPLNLRASIPGRVKHETTITESFNKADALTLGPDLSWTALDTSWQVVSNQAKVTTAFAQHTNRADSDLSSSDNYAQVQIAAVNNTCRGIGVITRKDGSATLSYYYCDYENVDSSGGATQNWRTFKRVAGTFTSIGSNTASTAASVSDVIKVAASGSSITRYRNGSSQNAATDTAVTTGLRGGLGGNSSTSRAGATSDVFEAGDIVASTILYTQLEGGTRGINRGGWIRSGN